MTTNETTAPLRLGFIGGGRMGQCAHLRNYATLPDCRVVALAEIRPALARAVAAQYSIPHTYGNHQDMLAAEELDALIVIQPFTRIGMLLDEIAPLALPIMIEKPLARSVAIGERILAQCQQHGARVMVGNHKRSDPAIIYAKAEIERLKASRELGDLRYIRLTMPAGDWPAGCFSSFIRSDEPLPELPTDAPAVDLSESAERAFVQFVNYYVHQINLLRHLLGESYQVTHADPAGVVFVGRSESGVPCTIEMTPYSTTTGWDESAFVAFERGYLKIDLPAPLAINQPGRVRILRDPGGEVCPAVTTTRLPAVDAMRQQAIHFLRFARGESAAPCDAAEALEDLNVAREYIRLLTGE